jgi:hypothetical protein
MKKTKPKALILLILLAFFILWSGVVAQNQEMKILTCVQLIEDTRELASYIESIHPEPYGDHGGKIAFHRRFQKILQAIPPEGMTVADFYELLLPFVAAVQDGHTYISLPFSREKSRFRLPLGWEIIEDRLFRNALGRKTLPLLVRLSQEPLPGGNQSRQDLSAQTR